MSTFNRSPNKCSRNNKYWGAIVCLVGLVFCWSAPAVAQPDPGAISFDPAEGTFVCAQVFVVEVLVDEIEDLRGFSLVIDYDEDIMLPLTVTAGSLLTGAACDNFFIWRNAGAAADSIAVDGASLGCSAAGPGSIVKIEFDGYVEGTTTLSVRHGILRTGTNENIPFTSQDATIHYICAVPVSNLSWSALKCIYR
jgi:hypothetical protein